MNRPRVRIRFAKQGNLRWIGHLDLVRLWERTFRRAGIRLAHSQGFHPKPKMSFPLALAVGIESLDELLEVQLAEPCSPEDLRAKLAAHAPPGLQVKEVELIPPATPKPRVRAVHYQMAIPSEQQSQVAQWIAHWAAGNRTEDPGLSPHARLLQSLESICLENGQLKFTLRVLPDGLPNPRDLLALLQLSDLESQGAVLIRTRVELHPPHAPWATRGRQ